MSCIPHCRLAYIGLGTMGFTARLRKDGKTLFITAREGLYAVETLVKGVK